MTSPVSASIYLENVNWKALVEVLSAEVVLHRPTNPAQFVVDLLRKRLEREPTLGAESINEWLISCYSDASSRVDEHGVIHDQPLSAPTP